MYGGEDKGVGSQLSLLGFQQQVGDTDETDANIVVGSGPWDRVSVTGREQAWPR